MSYELSDDAERNFSSSLFPIAGMLTGSGSIYIHIFFSQEQKYMMCSHHLYERDRSPCFGLNKLVLVDMPAKSYAAHLKGKIVFRMLNRWEGEKQIVSDNPRSSES